MVKNSSYKPLTLFLLIIAVVGILIFAFDKGTLFKGQLLGGQNIEEVSEKNLLPDLTVDINVDKPVVGEDLKVNAKIINLGPGILDGSIPYKYIIYVNGVEVFSNTESFSSMQAQDSFSFSYPVPRQLFKYTDKGKVKFVIDTENDIKEADENNNSKEIEYSY